jgi:glycosyltransferase involved in cell wall biosynthesis
MNICILSNKGGCQDEGQKNVALHLSNELAKRHSVFHFNAKKNLFSLKFWKNLKAFNPKIIQFFLRPNFTTFLYGKLIRLKFRTAKLIISALQPPLNLNPLKYFIHFLKPEMVLVLSEETELVFKNLGCETAFIPCGVDTEKFVPVAKEKKLSLRKKYGIDKDKFVILHVGHLTKGRELEGLIPLQGRNNCQVIIVGSPLFSYDGEVMDSLEKAGCIAWRKYFPNIEEIYQLADCYFFPTKNTSFCIELPLSVMEAMSCNLPVISTRFGALCRVFNEGKGFFFIDNEHDIYSALEQIQNRTLSIQTREKVLGLTWEGIALDLEEIYTHLLDGKF